MEVAHVLLLHVSEVQAVEQDEELIELRTEPPGPVEEAITAHILPLIPEGAKLQFGIGGIPDAVVSLLRDRDDLGVHTEMVPDGDAGAMGAARGADVAVQDAAPAQGGDDVHPGEPGALRLGGRQPADLGAALRRDQRHPDRVAEPAAGGDQLGAERGSDPAMLKALPDQESNEYSLEE